MHPGVEPPVLLHRSVRNGPYLLKLLDVGGNGRHLPARIPDLLDQGGMALSAAGADDHLGPPF